MSKRSRIGIKLAIRGILYDNPYLYLNGGYKAPGKHKLLVVARLLPSLCETTILVYS